ncbi:MAG: MFS transporter [Phycisphaerae bacterium]
MTSQQTESPDTSGELQDATGVDLTSAKAVAENTGPAFVAMAGTYCLGVFNDNFFKQAAFLLAVSLAIPQMQGYVVVFFTVPYLLLAAPAGWFADRFSKRHVVIAAKGLEVVAMLAGAAGLLLHSWPLILTMAFLMGSQSCMFSPALNGSIPELYPPEQVTPVNSILKVVTTVAILAGFATAGVVRELGGDMALAVSVVGISLVGLVVSLGTPRNPPADPEANYPWTGVIDTLRQLRGILDDRPLARIVGVAVFIWSLGNLQVLLLNPIGKEQFGWGDSATSMLLATELVGVAIGGILAGKVAVGPQWYRLLGKSLIAMSVFLGLVAVLPWLAPSWRYPALVVLLLGGGIFGGLVLVPCEAFVQVRPAGERKGAVIAAANFVIFAGILVSGFLANLLNALLLPSWSFVVVAIGAVAFGAYIHMTLGQRSEL